MKSTIHCATTVSIGRKDRKTNTEIKKPYAIFQNNKFIKDVDRVEQHRSYCSVLKKTVKWSKNLVLFLLNCALQRIFCVQDAKYKVKYKTFLHEVGRSCILEVQNRSESSSEDLQFPEKGA